MDTAIVVFTRDLRVHDNPALGGPALGPAVVPVFSRPGTAGSA